MASALVTPETAEALVRALQTCKDPSDFRLPEEKLGYVDDAQIDEPGFRLLGWVLEHRKEEDGLEEHDPLKRVRLSFTRPGQGFISHHDLRPVDGGRKLVTSEGRVVSWVELWSDEPPSERAYSRATYTSGRRTWVKTAELLDYLVRREMDLIFEAQIARQYAESHGTEREEEDEERRYEPGESRIYLLRRDGTLETMDGHRQLG